MAGSILRWIHSASATGLHRLSKQYDALDSADDRCGLRTQSKPRGVWLRIRRADGAAAWSNATFATLGHGPAN